MNIYREIFIFLIILFILEDKIRKKERIYIFTKILSVVIIIFLVGLRGIIGYDSSTYYNLFIEIPTLKELSFDFLNKHHTENFYLILNSIIKTLGCRFWVIFFIIALISLINIALFINYFSNYFFYSLAFYYTRWLFLKEFSQIRNGIACSFLYLGFIQLNKKKIKNYIVLILIGSLFHKTILFGLTFLLFKKIFNKKYLNKIILISILILPFINLKNYFNKFFSLVLNKSSLYFVYLTGEYSYRNNNILFFYSIFFVIIILFLNKYLEKIEKFKLLKVLFIYSVFINSSLFYYGDLCGRLSSFFNVEFVIQDKFICVFKNKIFIKFLMVIFLFLLFKINFIDRIEKIIIPYKTFL